MNSLKTTLERSRQGMMARSTAVILRGRARGARWLARAEENLAQVEGRVAARRATLNGKPIERLEKRVLGGIESVLDLVALRLRAQRRRLSPPRKRMRIEVQGVPVATPDTRKPRATARASKRWVGRASVPELAALSAKDLAKKIPTLTTEERKALLAFEKSNKKRKTVIATLTAETSAA